MTTNELLFGLNTATKMLEPQIEKLEKQINNKKRKNEDTSTLENDLSSLLSSLEVLEYLYIQENK